MNKTSALITELSEAVLQAMGSDPRTEACFEGVAIDSCADCQQLTAVTTLLIGEDGSRAARVCIDCMWN